MNTQVLGWLKRAGFKGPALRTMYGIVMRESGGNPHAYNGKGNDRSYGLAQINMLGKMGADRQKQWKLSSYDDLFDPMVNARVAYRMSQGGRDFGPWGLGPNAYRQGAGEDTIAKYLSEFDKAGIDIDSVQPAPRFRKPTLGQSSQRLSPSDLKSFDHRKLAMRSLASLASGDYDPMEGLSELVSARRDFEERQAAAEAQLPLVTPQKPPQGRTETQAPQPSGKEFVVPDTFEGTHVTDNLDWGSKSARDFVMPAGTPVALPEDVEVLYWHPTGAQGGGSMLVRTKSGREGWLGHIDNGLPAGTHVRAGTRIANISSDHPTPHLHMDWRAA